MTSNGFLNRRSRVRITPGTPSKPLICRDELAYGYAHEPRTSHRATVHSGTLDGTVDSRGVLELFTWSDCIGRRAE